MKTNWVLKDTSYPVLAQLPTKKNYITVATKGTPALIGQSEEPKRSLEIPDQNRIF
jgi:hypothetical protein